MNIIIQIDGNAGEVHSLLAREVLLKAAEKASMQIIVEIVSNDGNVRFPVYDDENGFLLLVSDQADWQKDQIQQYHGALKRVTFGEVYDAPSAVLPKVGNTAGSHASIKSDVVKIVAVTSCPTGIAHTFMAAEGLSQASQELGYEIRVETQGSVGAGTPLTAEEIADADLVIIAADREVDRARFVGKKVYASGTKQAISNGQNFIKTALEKGEIQQKKSGKDDAEQSSGESAGGVYKHLMTGVSFMLPFVVAGGLLIALSFAIGGVDVVTAEGTLGYTLFTIGAKGGFALMVPALAGFIAYSIADRPGIAPGMIGGMLAQNVNAGFIGGIIAGFIAGYSVYFAVRLIKLPKSLQGLMPVLILPLIGTLITSLLMIYVLGPPVAGILVFLTEWLRGLQGANAILVGALVGGMMALDMGGPVNKAAYATSVALLSLNVYSPMAASMIGGMTPPIALALACWVFPSRFTQDERSAKATTFILGLVFISEGAIPYAARNPFRVIPSLVIGSAVAGAIAMVTATGLHAPHGGIILVFTPGVVINYAGYFLALIIGTIVSTVVLGVLCKPIDKAVVE